MEKTQKNDVVLFGTILLLWVVGISIGLIFCI
jgi:hypothetical protein